MITKSASLSAMGSVPTSSWVAAFQVLRAYFAGWVDIFFVACDFFRGEVYADGTEFFPELHSQGKSHIAQSDNGNCFHHDAFHILFS